MMNREEKEFIKEALNVLEVKETDVPEIKLWFHETPKTVEATMFRELSHMISLFRKEMGYKIGEERIIKITDFDGWVKKLHKELEKKTNTSLDIVPFILEKDTLYKSDIKRTYYFSK